ncbi:MAG TPA: hypothetical protein VF950_25880 [Planctomycetota bacterium]
MKRSLFLLGLLGCSPTPEAAPPPPGRDLYFTLPSPLEARFLHLRADGVFRLYVRTLPMTKEALRGTWRVADDTGAVLRCDQWAHMVVRPPVRVRFGSDWARQVPHVRTSIADFLRERPAQADFSREELEDVGNWETVVGGEKAMVIPIGLDTPRVARADLEAVLPRLDAYRASGDPRDVHVRLHRHKDTEFLEWLDWSGYVEPRPIEEIRATIDGLGKSEVLREVWVRLTPEEFHRELGGDGFRYNR